MHKRQNAFTLVELLAVIIILAIVALIATPIILDVVEDARISAGKSEAQMILGGINNYCATEDIKYQLDNNYTKICTSDMDINDVPTMVNLGNAEITRIKYDGSKLIELIIESNNHKFTLCPNGQFAMDNLNCTDTDDTIQSTISSVWFGDSLVRGLGNDDKGFPEYYMELTNNNNVFNSSYSGSVIYKKDLSGQASTFYIGDVVSFILDKPQYSSSDLFVLDGGGNDCLGYYLNMYEGDAPEVGVVNTLIETPTPGDTIINRFETILYNIKTKMPNAKVLYIQPWANSQRDIENVVSLRYLTSTTLEEVNSTFGTNFNSLLEARPTVINAFTEGLYGFPKTIPLIRQMSVDLFEQIEIAMEKYGYEYIDVSSYVSENPTLYLKGDGIHITDAAYKVVTPVIIEKINNMFE